jgi:hypothetical protein
VIEAANAQETVTVLSHEETVVDLVFNDNNQIQRLRVARKAAKPPD